jgi:hypothetical protein
MDTCVNICREVMDAFSPINMNHGGLISNMSINSIPITGMKANKIHVPFPTIKLDGSVQMLDISDRSHIPPDIFPRKNLIDFQGKLRR